MAYRDTFCRGWQKTSKTWGGHFDLRTLLGSFLVILSKTIKWSFFWCFFWVGGITNNKFTLHKITFTKNNSTRIFMPFVFYLCSSVTVVTSIALSHTSCSFDCLRNRINKWLCGCTQLILFFVLYVFDLFLIKSVCPIRAIQSNLPKQPAHQQTQVKNYSVRVIRMRKQLREHEVWPKASEVKRNGA